MKYSKKKSGWNYTNEEVPNINSNILKNLVKSWDKLSDYKKDFMWGTATSSHQVEGNNSNNNWWKWEHTYDKFGNPKVKNGDNGMRACMHQKYYKEDIQLMKKLNVNTYRFSIEWSKIEPQQQYNDSSYYYANNPNLVFYDNLINELIKNGIEPIITLHHFTNPIWFDNIGSFEKDENIQYFENFCEKIFTRYKSKIKYWCIFNEPIVYCFHGYLTGLFPPGKHNLSKSVNVLFQIYKYYVHTYKVLRNLDPEKKCLFGIAHNFTLFEPWNPNSRIDKYISGVCHKYWNETFINFFKTGHFDFNYLPFVKVNKFIEDAPKTLDFVGINYYTRLYSSFSSKNKYLIDLKKSPVEHDTKMPFTMYPEGLMKVFKLANELGKNMIVTENGISTDDEDLRQLFLYQHISVLIQALQKGYNIKGYMYWSLLDNFEWCEGYTQHFGLHSYDKLTYDRKIKPAGKLYKHFLKLIKKIN